MADPTQPLVTGADARNTINSDYSTALNKATAGGQTEADFVKSNPAFQSSHDALTANYNTITDPSVVASELAHQQGRTSDPIYGDSAKSLVSTLQARQAALSTPAAVTPKPSAAAPGLVPATQTQATTQQSPQPSPYKPTGVATGNPGQDTAGNYTPQNASVESRIPGLMSTDNPIVQAAVGQSQRASAARGLENSSIGVQAGVQAAEASVLPIASQDAAQVAAQNQAAQTAAQTGALQEQSIGGTLQATSLQTSSAQAINTQNVQAARDNLNTQIASNERLLTQSLGSQATLQAAQLAMNKELTGQQLNAQEKMLVQQLNASMAQLGLSTSTQLQIAANQITAGQQQQVASGAGQYAAIYQDAVNQINANKDMPAAARTSALASVQAQYSSNMNFLSQLYNVQLTWTTTGPDGTKTTNTSTKAAA